MLLPYQARGLKLREEKLSLVACPGSSGGRRSRSSQAQWASELEFPVRGQLGVGSSRKALSALPSWGAASSPSPALGPGAPDWACGYLVSDNIGFTFISELHQMSPVTFS